ncbi:MAG TPA: hypothetical protein VN408_07830 [Actinoplanes sp.]|nr:hypothetical protein [Actinoplanes sp.]
MGFAGLAVSALMLLPAGVLTDRLPRTPLLVATCAAPAGPLLAGLLYDSYGQFVTFSVFAAVTAAITLTKYRSGAPRSLGEQGAAPDVTPGRKPG